MAGRLRLPSLALGLLLGAVFGGLAGIFCFLAGVILVALARMLGGIEFAHIALQRLRLALLAPGDGNIFAVGNSGIVQAGADQKFLPAHGTGIGEVFFRRFLAQARLLLEQRRPFRHLIALGLVARYADAQQGAGVKWHG